jgi:hypothetical protein
MWCFSLTFRVLIIVTKIVECSKLLMYLWLKTIEHFNKVLLTTSKNLNALFRGLESFHSI